MTIDVTAGRIPELDLSLRLELARRTAGMTQQQLADAIGIGLRSVSHYESGRQVKRPVLVSWALATGVPLMWLETGNAPTGDDGGGAALRARRDSNSQPSDSVFSLVRAA